MKGVLFVLALLTAASVANAYDIARTLRFTNDGKINGFRALNQPHLRRVSGVDESIDGIECKHVSDNRGKVWQCSVLNNESLRLGAYSVICAKNTDKTAYLVSTCTIEYELLPQVIKIISREKEPDILTPPAEILIQSSDKKDIGSAEFVTPDVEAIKVNMNETTAAISDAQRNVIKEMAFLVMMSFILSVLYYEYKNNVKHRTNEAAPVNNLNPVAATNIDVTENVETPTNTNPEPAPCTHPALRALRVKNPERFPRMKLTCRSCNKRVRLVDLHLDSEVDHREGHDNAPPSDAASVSKKQASKKCSRESHEW